jgi:hypothetical protein
VTKVGLSRTIRPAQYESFVLSVELTDDDVPPEQGESPRNHYNRMFIEAYRRILEFEMIHGLPADEARARLLKVKSAYNVVGPS